METINHGYFVSIKSGVFIATGEGGGIHSTQISGLRFENFLGANGLRRVQKVSFHSIRKKSFPLI